MRLAGEREGAEQEVLVRREALSEVPGGGRAGEAARGVCWRGLLDWPLTG